MLSGENKNRIITLLLEEILEQIIRVYNKVGSNFDSPEKMIPEDVPFLFKFYYGLYLKKYNDNKSKISDKDFEVLERIVDKYGFEREIISVDVPRLAVDQLYDDREQKSNKKQLSENDIDESFLDDNQKQKLKVGIIRFNKDQEGITSCENHDVFLLPSKSKDYLSSYYKLLIDAAEVYDLSKDEQLLGFIQNLLIIHKDTRDEGSFFDFYSPLVINNLNKMYQGVCVFYNTLIKNLNLENDQQISIESAYMYKSIVVAKTQRIFRWYTLNQENQLCHAALPPRPHDEEEDFSLMLKSRSMLEYSSFEGVGELRVAEKIINAIEAYFDIEKDKSDFNIALLGDINYPVNFLVEYVNKCLKKDYKEKNIKYNVYTNTKKLKIKKELKQIIKVESNLNDVFSNVRRMDQMIEENHLIFMLDCTGLYHKPYVDTSIANSTLIARYKANEYDRYHAWLDTPENIFVKNPLDDLYENLVALSVYGKMGKISKTANEVLINHCDKKIKKSSDKTLYVYMSDLDCFNSLYCVNRSFVRIEQYNDKKIGIVKISQPQESNNLRIGQRKVITFNLWQIVKHIALEERKIFTSKIINNNSKEILKTELNLNDDNLYTCLHYFYFGLDYSDWRNGLKVYYTFKNSSILSKDSQKEVCKPFIDNVLKSVLKRTTGSIYNQYCKYVVNSILYGNARNVEDMLFLHLLKKGVVNVEIKSDIEFNNEIKRYIQNSNQLADKRVYEAILDNFDTPLLSIAEKFKVDTTLEKNHADKKQVFKNIKRACEDLGYSHSDLYKKCIRELGEE